jgi:hypothetical protein
MYSSKTYSIENSSKSRRLFHKVHSLFDIQDTVLSTNDVIHGILGAGDHDEAIKDPIRKQLYKLVQQGLIIRIAKGIYKSTTGYSTTTWEKIQTPTGCIVRASRYRTRP